MRESHKSEKGLTDIGSSRSLFVLFVLVISRVFTAESVKSLRELCRIIRHLGRGIVSI
jgi:hypothetical protein